MAEKNDLIFKESLARGVASDANGAGYLGDPAVIEAMVRRLIARAMEMRDMSQDGARIHIQEICRQFGGELLGKDPNLSPVIGWNVPGGIDEFLARQLGLPEGGPHKRCEHAAALLVGEVMDVAEFAAQPGVLPEQWTEAMSNVVRKWTSLLMGITLAEFATR